MGGGLFAALRQRAGFAESITGPLLEEFQRDFELGMASFRATRDVDSAELLREIAYYFANFQLGPGNLYVRLVETIRASRRLTTLVTTNYDLLLEQAVNTARWMFSYAANPVPTGNIALRKIHGSCNFLPDIGENSFLHVRFSGLASNVEAPLRFVRTAVEIEEFCNIEDSLAPAIAVYAPGKSVLFCPRFVLELQEGWKRAAAAASVIYVIGLRILPEDEHIWGVIASSKGRVEYVGYEPHEFLDWARAINRRHVHVLERTFEAALPPIRIQMRN